METFLTRNDKVKNLKPRLSTLKNKLMKGKTQRNTKKIIQDHNEENTEEENTTKTTTKKNKQEMVTVLKK